MLTAAHVLVYVEEVILSVYIFWLLFVMCMAFYAAWHKMPLIVKILAVPAVVVAYVFDVVWNWTVASLVFCELPPPHAVTFTKRLSYYKSIDGGWRGELSHFICDYFLDVFQAGGHCR